MMYEVSSTFFNNLKKGKIRPVVNFFVSGANFFLITLERYLPTVKAQVKMVFSFLFSRFCNNFFFFGLCEVRLPIFCKLIALNYYFFLIIV